MKDESWPVDLCSEAWESPEGLNHPLLGRVWQPSEHRFLQASELRDLILSKRIILLGEKHDNPDHQRLATSVLEFIRERGTLGSIALELFSADDRSFLERLVSSRSDFSDKLLLAEGYHGGFPLADYSRVIEAALSSDIPLVPANVSKSELIKIYQDGNLTELLTRERLADLALDLPLPVEAEQALRDRLYQAHCKMLPPSKLQPMFEIQRLRDATMADAVASCSPPKICLLLAGSEHVRKDYGAAYYLAAKGLGDRTISIVFKEVAPDLEKAEDYLEHNGGSDAFDLLWFTASVPPLDHCSKFKP